MSIEKSMRGIKDFLQRNDGLTKDIMSTGKDAVVALKGLAARVDSTHREAQELIDQIDTAEFVVARTDETKRKQQELLNQIGTLSDEIWQFASAPELTIPLQGRLAALYVALANTFTDEIRRIITFTEEDVRTFKELLKQAVLDAEKRQRQADILDAAVQLTKLALKGGVKLAA